MYIDILEEFDKKTNTWKWTEEYRYLKGQPWDFGNRKYLEDVYKDTSKDLIFVKGRQVEASELSINKVLHFLTTHPHTKCLYTFPTKEKCMEFGGERFFEAFNQSSKLRDFLIDDGSVFTKKFKNGSYLYLKTASRGGDKARSIAGDLLVCDEYQDFDQSESALEEDYTPARDVLKSNLDHSEYKKTITLGTPKLLDSEFEHLWLSSTQHHWIVVCHHCQTHQKLTLDNIIDFDVAFEDGTKLKDIYFGCIKCKGLLDRSIGYWESQNEKSLLTGYHLSQLIVPWKTAQDILLDHGTKYHKGKKKRAFYNENLGLFYSGSAQPFNEQILELCYKTDETIWDGYKGSEGVYMGIDWGDSSTICIIHYDIEFDMPKILFAKKFNQGHLNDQWPEIAKYINQFNVKRVVADMGYGKSHNQELQRKFPGKVYQCIYVAGKSKTDTVVYDEKRLVVNVDRDLAIADLVGRAELGCDRPGGLTIPWDEKGRSILKEPFLKEMKNIIAKQINNRTTYERGGPDHFTHALLYAIVASRGKNVTTKHRVRTSTVRLGNRR